MPFGTLGSLLQGVKFGGQTRLLGGERDESPSPSLGLSGLTGLPIPRSAQSLGLIDTQAPDEQDPADTWLQNLYKGTPPVTAPSKPKPIVTVAAPKPKPKPEPTKTEKAAGERVPTLDDYKRQFGLSDSPEDRQFLQEIAIDQGFMQARKPKGAAAKPGATPAAAAKPGAKLPTMTPAPPSFGEAKAGGGLAPRPAKSMKIADITLPATPANEQAFQSWYRAWAQREHMNPNPDDPEQKYDYRAAYSAGITPPRTSQGEHWPSDFKKGGHPNEIVGGFNTRTGERVPGTKQASEPELIALGYDPETAAALTRKNAPAKPLAGPKILGGPTPIAPAVSHAELPQPQPTHLPSQAPVPAHAVGTQAVEDYLAKPLAAKAPLAKQELDQLQSERSSRITDYNKNTKAIKPQIDALTTLTTELNAEKAQLDALHAQVNPQDSASVNAFNQRVQAYQTKVQQHDALSAQLKPQIAELDRQHAKITDLEARGKAGQVGTLSQADVAAAQAVAQQPKTWFQAAKDAAGRASEWAMSGTGGDAAVAWTIGSQTVVDAAVGIADATLNYVYGGPMGMVQPDRISTGKMLEYLGYSTKENKELLNRYYSKATQTQSEELAKVAHTYNAADQARVDALTQQGVTAGMDPEAAKQAAMQEVDQSISKGTLGKRAVDYAVEALKRPRLVATSTIESLPLIAASWGLSAPLAAAGMEASAAGAAVEGLTGFGSQAEALRQQNPGGASLTPDQLALVGAAGVGTSLIGYFGGRLAHRLGIPDPDTMMAAAFKDPTAKKHLVSLIKAVPASMIIEGGEEFGQGVQEQVASNLAEHKPWHDGMAENAIMGMFAGAWMGAGTQFSNTAMEHIRTRFGAKPDATVDAPPDISGEVAPPPPPGAMPGAPTPALPTPERGREQPGSRPQPWTPPPAPPAPPRGPEAPAAVLQALGQTGAAPAQAQQFLSQAQTLADRTNQPMAVVAAPPARGGGGGREQMGSRPQPLGMQIVPADQVPEGTQVVAVIDPIGTPAPPVGEAPTGEAPVGPGPSIGEPPAAPPPGVPPPAPPGVPPGAAPAAGEAPIVPERRGDEVTDDEIAAALGQGFESGMFDEEGVPPAAPPTGETPAPPVTPAGTEPIAPPQMALSENPTEDELFQNKQRAYALAQTMAAGAPDAEVRDRDAQRQVLKWQEQTNTRGEPMNLWQAPGGTIGLTPATLPNGGLVNPQLVATFLPEQAAPPAATEAEVPVATPPESQPPVSRPAAPAGMPMMITKAQRTELRARGYDDAAINAMKPAEAHAILQTPAKPKEEAPAAVPKGWSTTQPADVARGAKLGISIGTPSRKEVGTIGAAPTDRGWVAHIDTPIGSLHSDQAYPHSEEAFGAGAALIKEHKWPVRGDYKTLVATGEEAEDWGKKLNDLIAEGVPAAELSDAALAKRADRAVGPWRKAAREELQRRQTQAVAPERRGDQVSDDEIAAALGEGFESGLFDEEGEPPAAPAAAEAAPRAEPETAREPTKHEAKLADIDKERAALDQEEADLIARITQGLNRVGVNTPLDPKLLGDVVKLARTYARRGILHFKEAALRFDQMFGAHEKSGMANRYFEVAWPIAQELAKGATLPEAMKTVQAQKDRPKVATVVEAQRKEQVAAGKIEGIKTDQLARRIDIARLSGKLEAKDPDTGKLSLPADSKVRARLVARLEKMQSDYDEAMAKLEGAGVDVKALDKEIEQSAAQAIKEGTAPKRREKPTERPRRNILGTNALEDAISPEGRAGLDALFGSFDPIAGRTLRAVRESMELYQRLLDAADGTFLSKGRPAPETARAAAKALRDTFDAYARDMDNAETWDPWGKAMLDGLSLIIGVEAQEGDFDTLAEGRTVRSAAETGELIFDTLDPKTATFDIEAFHAAYGEVEFRRDPRTVFPEPTKTVNLHEGRNTRKVMSHAEGLAQIKEWQAAAKQEGQDQSENHKKIILSLYDRTGIISKPWEDAGYSVRRFDVRAGEDLTEFGEWMDEIEQMVSDGYTIQGVLAQPPCTSFTVSGNQHWPDKHDRENYAWLVSRYGEKAAEHFNRPLDYANTLVAIVKLVVAQSNPRFYMMENPIGRIRSENNLPEATLAFNPDDYGEGWTKGTKLYGEFNPKLPLARVYGETTEDLKKRGIDAEGGEGSRIHKLSSKKTDERALTSVGFAYAFFMGNKQLAEQDWTNQPLGGEEDYAEPPDEHYQTPKRPTFKTGDMVIYQNQPADVKKIDDSGRVHIELEGGKTLDVAPRAIKHDPLSAAEHERLEELNKKTDAADPDDDDEGLTDQEWHEYEGLRQRLQAGMTWPRGRFEPAGWGRGAAQEARARANEEALTKPVPVISFRSGNQRSPADMAGFIKAGQDVGVTAVMAESVRDALIDHVNNGGSGFVDSGAFGSTKIEKGKGVAGVNFDAILSRYNTLLDAIDAEQAPGLHVVAPDVPPAWVDKKNRDTVVKRGAKGAVPRSFAEETKAVQDQYQDQIRSLLDRGATVLVPVQVGPGMSERAVEVVGQFPGALIALPGNEGPISDTQFEAMLAKLDDEVSPPGSTGNQPTLTGFHFLGIGDKGRSGERLNKLVGMIRKVFPRAVITSDASRSPALFGEGRPAQKDYEDRLARMAHADAGEQVDDGALSYGVAGQFFRGEWTHFTSDELLRVFEAAGVSPEEANRAREDGRLDDLFHGDKYATYYGAAVEAALAGGEAPSPAPPGVEEAEGGYPPIMSALYEIAYDRSHASLATRIPARIETVATTDTKSPAREFTYGSTAIYKNHPVTVQEYYPTHPRVADGDREILPAGPAYRIVDERDGFIHHQTVQASDLAKVPPKSQAAKSRKVKPAAAVTDADTFVGPRKVGGRYSSDYWGTEYTVEQITRDETGRPTGMTVKWADGHTTTHKTAWGKGDKIISEPAAAPPLTAPAAEPVPTKEEQQLTAIEAERAKVQQEQDDLIKSITRQLNRVGANTALDPALLKDVVKLARTFLRQGILNFREASVRFHQIFGAHEKGAGANRYFEVAWPIAQEMAKGASLPEAMKTVAAMKGRPKVATEVEAYNKEQAAKEGRVDENGPVAGGEGGTPDAGGRGGGGVGGPGAEPGVGAGVSEGTQPGPGAGNRPGGTLPGPTGNPGLTRPLYTITPADAVGTGTPRVRVANNLAAIRLVKTLLDEKRQASEDEQKVLVKYVGWGGLPRIFEYWKNDEGEDDERSGEYAFWRQQHAALKELLTPEEFRAAANSTQNAHYTSPTVVKAMWDAIQRLGVRSGSVLEPSAGIGHFVGLAPAEARGMTFALVEKDLITAQIAAALYPGAYNQNAPFEQAKLPSNHFTVAASNVPFGDIPITDKAFEGPSFLKRRIHNYFFAKALDKVAPGGLVAFITSHGTLDAVDDTGTRVRQYLAGRADFLGAIRLPYAAFKSNANTEVVTDIIFLRKRHEGAARAHVADWINSTPVKLQTRKGETVEHNVNEYFQQHPEMVLGEQNATGKMRAEDQYNVTPPGEKPAEQVAHWQEHGADQLTKAIANLPADAIDMTPPATTLDSFTSTLPAAGSRPFEYVIHEGKLAQILDGKVTPVDESLSKEDQKRVRAMLPIRESIRKVYDRIAEGADAADVEAAQQQLTTVYDAFVKKHGYLSARENFKAFHEDPDLALLLSLEEYDPERETATKTAIFTTATTEAARQARKAQTPAEALHIALNEKGRIDLERAGQLLNVSPEAAATQLQAANLIIDTPTGWQLPGQYLSGNVRVKLAEAEGAAALDPRYTPAVEALKSVIPEDVPAHTINVRLGASWVPPEVITAFVANLVNERNPKDLTWKVTYSPSDARWNIEGPPGDYSTSLETPHINTKRLLLAALNDRNITIKTRAQKDAPAVVDAEATALARARREELYTKFQDWLLNDQPERRTWAVRTYNDLFNAHVEPKVDGAYLTFPGLATVWRDKMREHQRNFVARVLQFGNTMAAHVVGAGKTLALISAGMELRRNGLARKPLYVMPNHLIGQWASDFLQFYPNAKIMVADLTDLDADKRMRFTARIASGDWDAVLIPQSMFVRISMSPEAETAYHAELKDDIETAIIAAWRAEQAGEAGTGTRGGGQERKRKTPPHIKHLQKLADKMQRKLDDIADRPKDDMLTFEQLGVDALFVDEAHEYKNLYFQTSQQAAGIPQDSDAQRATDMYLKTRYINQLTNYRNVVLATGTPVSNSMAEIFVMQKLLQEQTLRQAGVDTFDAWLNQFGLISTVMDLDPSGTGMSARRRLAEFQNLKRLAELFRQVVDVKMIDDLPEIKQARPPLHTGEPEIVVVPATDEQVEYLQLLAARADALDPKTRHIDNAAKITADGRLSALDMRMLDRRRPDNPKNKISEVSKAVAEIYHEYHDRKGTQVIFLDQGTPAVEKRKNYKDVWDPDSGTKVRRPLTEEEQHRGFNLYDDLKKKLIARGVPAGQIAFIHDTKQGPKEKHDGQTQALFRKMREGKVRVLIGSTGMMGTGMNVQDRLVAEHNVDPKWKPSDTEQAYGRILRPGNKFATKGTQQAPNPDYDPKFAVRILNYITAGRESNFGFDAYMWGVNEQKAKVIAKFYSGDVTDERIGLDLEQTVLNAGQLKAAATGNPLILEHTKAQSRVEQLALEHRGYQDQQREARWSLGSAQRSLETYQQAADRQQKVLGLVTPAPESPTATIDGEEVVSQKSIGEKLIEKAKGLISAQGNQRGFGEFGYPSWSKPAALGTYRGLTIWLRGDAKHHAVISLSHPDAAKADYEQLGELQLRVKKTVEDGDTQNEAGRRYTFDDVVEDWQEPEEIGRKIGQVLRQSQSSQNFNTERIAHYTKDIERQTKILSGSFQKQAELDRQRARVAELEQQLGITAQQTQRDQDVVAGEDEDEGGGGEEAMVIWPQAGIGWNPKPAPRQRQPPSSRPPQSMPVGPLPEEVGLKQERKSSVFGIADAIRKYVHPEGFGEEARGAAGTIRHEGALSYRELKKVEERLKAFSRRIDKLSRDKKVEYWDAAEHGRLTGDPDIDAGNAELHALTKQYTDELVNLDRLKATTVIEHYVGRFWSVRPDYIPNFLAGALGRRPLEGPKSFLKQRSWESFVEGIKAIQAAQTRIDQGNPRAGDERLAKIRPATYNWVESQLAKIAEMQRVIAAERMVRAEEGSNRAKKVLTSMGNKPPKDANGDDWVRIGDGTDPAFTVYGPKKIQVQSAFDQKLMSGLHNFARSLGIHHYRAISLGAGRWGWAVGKSNIATKAGSPETVLMHEIGHSLDERYGLRQKWVGNPKMKTELQKLADMREEGTPNVPASRRRYLRKGAEKIANAVHAFIYMPEQMKKIAPNTYWAIYNLAKSTPELNQLIELSERGKSLKLGVEVSEHEIPGFPVLGHWYAPKAAAAVWTNHLSRGARGNPFYDVWSGIANTSAQILLGLSGFHLTTIAREGINSSIAQAIDATLNQGLQPQFGQAAMALARAPLAIGADVRLGSRIMQEYRTPGRRPELAKVLDAMIAGGFRGTAENEFWRGDRMDSFRKSWQRMMEGAVEGDPSKALLNGVRVPFRAFSMIIEKLAYPIMGKYVPLMKTGATYRAVADAMAKLPPTASTDQIHEAMWSVVKEMDFRYGQVVYDNHFVNRMTKDIAQAMFLAPGWTFGTATLIARGLKQGAAIPIRGYKMLTGKPVGPIPKELVGPSAAYWMGGVAAFMFINGILTFLHTGEPPEAKDYFAYRDGTLDDDGNPNRHILPGYEMRDVYGWRYHPFETFTNKLSPMISFFSRALRNRTYFGDLVRDPEADSWTQALQLGRQVVEDMGTPLTIQNWQESQHRGGAGVSDVVTNALGITPAKREFERTPAQNALADYLAREGRTARTPDEVKAADERRELRTAFREHDATKVSELLKTGRFTEKQIKRAQTESSKETFIQRGFSGLTIDHAIHVYELASPQERAEIEEAMRKKHHLVEEAPPENRKALLKRYTEAIKLPVDRTPRKKAG